MHKKNFLLFLLLLLLLTNNVFSNTITSFRINDGALFTNNPDLVLTINTNAPENKMRFSCNNVNWSDFEIFSETKDFDLSINLYGCNNNEGLKTIYVDVNFDSGLRHSTQNSITLDYTDPIMLNFSPSGSIIGDGANGQLVNVNLSDNNDLESISFSLKRGATTIYDSNSNACSIIGKVANCSFTDYFVDTGDGIYYYDIFLTDSAGNTNTYQESFSFTDSIAPEKPIAPEATISNTTINLEWTENTENDLNDYAVYKSTQTSFDCNEETFVARTISNEYSDQNLDENTTYFYKVSAFDLTGNESNCSEQGEFKTLFDNNLVPEIFRLDVLCDSNEWCYDNNPSLYFFLDNSEYSWLLTTNSTKNPADCTFGSDCNTESTMSFDDLSDGTHYFRVKAVKPTGASPVAEYILKIDSTSPEKPDPKLKMHGRSVLLYWNEPKDVGGSGIYGYDIYKSVSESFNTSSRKLIATLDKNDNNYLDPNVELGKKYYYRVIAIDLAGNNSSDYNTPTPSIEVPDDLNDVFAEIIIKNFDGEETNYFNKAEDFNLTMIFSKEVYDLILYKKIDDHNTEIVVDLDNATQITHLFTSSSNYKKIDFNYIASHPINDLNGIITIYFDEEKPSISFINLLENEKISFTKKIEINATDNFEVKKVELFLDSTKIGEATKNINNWSFDLDPNKYIGNELKAIATDGAKLKEETKINIILEKTITTNGESVINKINEAYQKQIDIHNQIVNKNINLSEEESKLNEDAEKLLLEAEELLESNKELAMQKALLAMEKFDSLLESIQKPRQENVFFNTFFVALGIIAIIVGIISFIMVFKKTRTAKKIVARFNKHNMQIDEDIKTKK